MALICDVSQETRRRVHAAIDALNALEASDFAEVLSAAADRCGESAVELESAWQDVTAGMPWVRLQRILDAAAGKATAGR